MENTLAKKTQVWSELDLALVSSFPSRDCEQNKSKNQAEDLAHPVGPDRLPGAR